MMSSKSMKTKINTNSMIFLLLFLVYSTGYIGRKCFSACITDMSMSLQIGKTLLGTVNTCFMLFYGMGQMINGWLGDRFSPNKMIFAGLLGAGFCNLCMSLSSKLWMLTIFWSMNGYFCSMLWSPVVRCLGLWIPEEERTKAATNISASLPTGQIASLLLSSFILHFFSWRIAFAASGMIVLTVACVFHFRFNKLTSASAENQSTSPLNTTANSKVHISFSSDLNQPSLWFCIVSTGLLFGVATILFNGMIKDGVTEWIPAYLSDYFSISSGSAALLTTILPIVNLAGVYLASAIFKITRNELITSAILFGVCLLALILLFTFGKNYLILSVLFIACSTCCMLGVNNMLLTFIPLRFAALGRSSSVTGFLNSSSYLAAAASSTLIGYLAEYYGWNMTMISWILAAVFGTTLCLVGSIFWKKGIQKINDRIIASSMIK